MNKLPDETSLRERRARVNDEQWLEQAEARNHHEWRQKWERHCKSIKVTGVWFFWIPTIICGVLVAASAGMCALALIGAGPTP